MQFQTVPTGSIVGMIFSLLIAFGIPIALCIVIRMKTKARISSFFIGCLTFLVFALVLEQLLHTVVFRVAGTILSENIFLYALYGGAAAAIFEETGRLVSMKLFLKKNLNRENALMYGAGHGGFEAIALLGFASINNLLTSIMINTGTLQNSLALLDAATQESTVSSLSALWTLPSYQFFLGGIERIIAMTLHISLSIFVYKAVKEHRIHYFLLSLFVHFFIDFLTVLCSNYVSVLTVELILLFIVALVAYFAFRLYRGDTRESEHVLS